MINKEQYKALKRICNKFEKEDRIIKKTYRRQDGKTLLMIFHEEERHDYKLIKQICNKFEYKQRTIINKLTKIMNEVFK